MKKIVVVCSSKGEHCPDTARALAFLLMWVRDVRVEVVRQGSHRAESLWVDARVFVSEKSGHPLVCLVEEGVMTMAVVEPDSEALAVMLSAGGYRAAKPDEHTVYLQTLAD
jgi:hypothetical protein